MHHAGVAEMAPSAHGEAVAGQPVAPAEPGPHDPGMDHSTLHLCLAVLGAVIALALVLWLLRTVNPDTSPISARTRGAAPARPPPPRPGRDLLSTFCVLRI
jgi:hypothetical protein